jgi:hypothetical protein
MSDFTFQETIDRLIAVSVEKALERRLETSAPVVPERSLTAPDALPVTLDVAELAEFLRLGTRDAKGRRPGGVRTIRQWIAQGRIPCRRANGRVLFLTSEILAWTAADGVEHGKRKNPSVRMRGRGAE